MRLVRIASAVLVLVAAGARAEPRVPVRDDEVLERLAGNALVRAPGEAPLAFARRALLSGPDTPIAGFRIRIDLALELFHRSLRLRHLPVQRRPPPERASPRVRPYPHPVLSQFLQIDQSRLAQRRQMFDQQTVQQIGTANPEVRQRVIVQRDPATEPAVDVMAVAEPVQRSRAADAVARGVQPKRQQQPRRWRRMTAGRRIPP